MLVIEHLWHPAGAALPGERYLGLWQYLDAEFKVQNECALAFLDADGWHLEARKDVTLRVLPDWIIDAAWAARFGYEDFPAYPTDVPNPVMRGRSPVGRITLKPVVLSVEQVTVEDGWWWIREREADYDGGCDMEIVSVVEGRVYSAGDELSESVASTHKRNDFVCRIEEPEFDD